VKMSTYSVRPADSGVGFDIIVKNGNGARNTLLGFGTEADALAWIARDKRLNDATDPFMSQSISLRRASGIEYPEMVVSQTLTANGHTRGQGRMPPPPQSKG
jgi:hypothetical protein